MYLRVESDALEQFVAEILVRGGLSDEDARIGAEVIVECDRRGVSSHGLVALPAYVRQVHHGGINPHPEWRTVTEKSSIARIDADRGMGQVNGVKAMRLAVRKAKVTGFGSVTLFNSNHFGGGASFALEAVQANMLGEVYSNARPCMSAPGATGRVIGNNPICLAAPGGSRPPIVFDIALSTVAYGKVAQAERSGAEIPKGWIIDAEGRDTTDPSAWQRGAALLPAAGHKGYGLSLFVEIITGIVGGGGITHDLRSFRREPESGSNVTHTFRAIDIEAFMPIEEYYRRLEKLARDVKQSTRRGGLEEIYLPGERGAAAADRASKEGVPILESTYEALKRLGEEESVLLPPPLATP